MKWNPHLEFVLLIPQFYFIFKVICNQFQFVKKYVKRQIALNKLKKLMDKAKLLE
jgi:hypothetical protein